MWVLLSRAGLAQSDRMFWDLDKVDSLLDNECATSLRIERKSPSCLRV
jgi:hypothetical protein